MAAFNSVSRDVIGALPGCLQKFIAFEQMNLWRLERVRGSQTDALFPPEYLPERRSVFQISWYWVPASGLYVYGEWEGEATALRGRGSYGTRAERLFPVHPMELPRYSEFLTRVGAVDATSEGLRFWATPTSSTRTLLVWPEAEPERAFFAKLSVIIRMLGDRRLHRRRVASSIGLSALVSGCARTLPAGVRYFPETLGLVPRLMQDSGVIFRGIPSELRDGRVILAPLFALIGGSTNHPPLLLEMMKAGRYDAQELLEGILLEKFANLWVDFVFKSGLILEAHGQDLLLALSPHLVPTGTFYYRDFEGLTVDWGLRRALGLPVPQSLPHTFDWFATYETWGNPLYQQASIKMRTSLYDYLDLVLAQIETAILGWSTAGLVGRDAICAGELTGKFSWYLRRAIQERFAMRETEEYDIHRHLNRFVKFLMKVRREVMDGRCGDESGAGGAGQMLNPTHDEAGVT